MSVKKNAVKKICDGISSEYSLKGYIMFEDCYIGEHDKLLVNQDGVEFKVLDHRYKRELICNDPIPEIMNGYIWKKFSCVKLDKVVMPEDVLYLK